MWVVWVAIAVGSFLLLTIVHDLIQRKHAILRNFPIIGHFRYLLEAIGPELRQYIVTSNDEELPFNRDQRRWVYASSKKQNNYFGFGTDSDMERSSNYLIIKQSSFPIRSPHPDEPDYDPQYRTPCAKVLGSHRGRRRAFRPNSIVNVSAMSYGSLSNRAVHALNAGCLLASQATASAQGRRTDDGARFAPGTVDSRSDHLSTPSPVNSTSSNPQRASSRSSSSTQGGCTSRGAPVVVSYAAP